MAMALRSCCLFGRKPPPRDCFSFKTRLPGKLALPLDRSGKFAAAFGGSLSGLSDVQHLLLVDRENFVLDHCDNVLKQLTPHQGNLDLKFLTKVLLTFNAMVLATPLQALAETCEAEDSFFNMPLLLLVALVGATVGGLLARQRRGELQKVNEQLRQINAALRRQAKIESYAPTLSYAPVGSRLVENDVIVDPRREEMIARLKAGKSFLRNQDPEKAFGEFKAGLELAQALKDPIEEKKAVRGLGASLQRQGKYREAIKYFNMVLKISDREGEDSGNTEAYGAIADCYTELGDLERAGKFYDNYIARLESD